MDLPKGLEACAGDHLYSGMQIVLWLYLIYRGRMPERVLISMNLMLIVPLLLLAHEYVWMMQAV